MDNSAAAIAGYYDHTPERAKRHFLVTNSSAVTEVEIASHRYLAYSMLEDCLGGLTMRLRFGMKIAESFLVVAHSTLCERWVAVRLESQEAAWKVDWLEQGSTQLHSSGYQNEVLQGRRVANVLCVLALVQQLPA